MANEVSKKKSVGEPTFQFVDNRPEAVTQRKLQNSIRTNNIIQTKQVIQLEKLSAEELEEWSLISDDEIASAMDGMEDDEKEQIGTYRAEKAAKAKLKKEWDDALATCVRGSSCITWTYATKTYHVNISLGTFHVTLEASPKIHYFFEGTGSGITSKQAAAGERNSNSRTFSQLPKNVQEFVKANWDSLIL